MAVCVTAPLEIVASKSTRMVEIWIQPDEDSTARVLSRGIVARSYGGPVFLDFKADLRDPSIASAALLIRPDARGEFYMQNSPRGYEVHDGVARGTAQLGSAEFPITHDEQYSFKLVRMDDGAAGPHGTGVLAEGQILARVTDVAGPDRTAIAFLGLLATIIQILHELAMAFLGRSDAVETGQ